MTKFHIMHCIPHPRMHGLNGYMEVIESVDWGLKALGHTVTYAVNNTNTEAVNIIFGAQVLPIDFMKKLPKSTIVYNFEQLRGLSKEEIRPELHFAAANFRIWDYSDSNLEAWKLIGADEPRLVPVSYAPTLTRIPKLDVQDIDILIYGMSGEKRLDAFHDLSHAGFVVVFVSGLYAQARDTLIARSKIVLNVNLYDFAQIFEIVRVSYLLANKKAVVATRDSNTFVEQDISNSIKLTTSERLVEDCAWLLNHDIERHALEATGYDNFSKRDICRVLRVALSDSVV